MTLLKNRLIYSYLSLVFYFIIYVPFFFLCRKIDNTLPEIYINWGYFIGFVFFITRTFRLLNMSSKNSRINYFYFFSFKKNCLRCVCIYNFLAYML